MGDRYKSFEYATAASMPVSFQVRLARRALVAVQNKPDEIPQTRIINSIISDVQLDWRLLGPGIVDPEVPLTPLPISPTISNENNDTPHPSREVLILGGKNKPSQRKGVEQSVRKVQKFDEEHGSNGLLIVRNYAFLPRSTVEYLADRVDAENSLALCFIGTAQTGEDNQLPVRHTCVQERLLQHFGSLIMVGSGGSVELQQNSAVANGFVAQKINNLGHSQSLPQPEVGSHAPRQAEAHLGYTRL